MTSISSLPNELLHHIFRFLDVPGIAGSLKVCHRWRTAQGCEAIALQNLKKLVDNLNRLDTMLLEGIQADVWIDEAGGWLALKSPDSFFPIWVGEGPCPWTLGFKRRRLNRPVEHVPVPPPNGTLQISCISGLETLPPCQWTKLDKDLSPDAAKVQKLCMALLNKRVEELRTVPAEKGNGFWPSWYLRLSYPTDEFVVLPPISSLSAATGSLSDRISSQPGQTTDGDLKLGWSCA